MFRLRSWGAHAHCGTWRRLYVVADVFMASIHPLLRLRAWCQSLTVLSLSALPITETEDRLIAAAAMIGLSSQPKTG